MVSDGEHDYGEGARPRSCADFLSNWVFVITVCVFTTTTRCCGGANMPCSPVRRRSRGRVVCARASAGAAVGHFGLRACCFWCVGIPPSLVEHRILLDPTLLGGIDGDAAGTWCERGTYAFVGYCASRALVVGIVAGTSLGTRGPGSVLPLAASGSLVFRAPHLGTLGGRWRCFWRPRW